MLSIHHEIYNCHRMTFLEKARPEDGPPPTNRINAGAYVIERSVVEQIPAGRAVSFEREVFPGLVVGLIHGRLGTDDKDAVMRRFKAGEIHVLVSTTVIEVGIDVPNASVMLIEHAERFGLSQMHQLRGRVGRDRHQSHCLLLYQSPLSDEGRDRLKAMTDTSDGFEIAERDLRLRGPGDFFGTRQAGIPTFRMIDLVRDRELLDTAQREAARWFEASSPSSTGIDQLLASWEQRFKLMEVG